MSYTEQMDVHGMLSTEFSGAAQFARFGTEGTVDFLVDELIEFYHEHYKTFTAEPVRVEIEPADRPRAGVLIIIAGDPEVYGEDNEILLDLDGYWHTINAVARAFKVRLTGK